MLASKIYSSAPIDDGQMINDKPTSDLVLSLKDVCFKGLLTQIDIDMHDIEASNEVIRAIKTHMGKRTLTNG